MASDVQSSPPSPGGSAPAPSTGLLSFGFSRLSQQRKRTLRYILLGSLGVHVLGMLIFGGMVLAHYLQEEKTVFEAPPPSKTYKPREVELKVKVQKRQKSSSRPAIVPRLVAMKPSELALPEIKVDPKLITTTFQPKFKAATGKGLGAGLGGGHGLGGFGEGMSAVNFFGIQAKGERIAVLVDVSVSMIEEERGGFAGYLRVKQRVGDVIDALKDGTLFNLIVFADGCSVMENQMVYAKDETRQKAKLFLRPFNTEGNYGLDNGNFNPGNVGVPAAGGTTRLDLALTAAMQQGADTILIISDGLPQVQKVQDASRMQAHAQQMAQWNQQHAGEVAAYANAVAAAPVERVWVPPTPARPPSKAALKEGAKPDPGAPARAGYWTEVRQTHGIARPQAPALPPPGFWNLTDFINHIGILYESTHKPKGLKQPQIHSIGYQIDRDGGAFLNDLARAYKGQYRLVRKLK